MAKRWTVVRPSPVHAWGAAIVVDGVLIAEMAAEDAEEAARCVNAHDAVVAALELARVNLMAWNSSGLAPWEAEEMNTLYEASPEIQAIDAALRAAKGEG